MARIWRGWLLAAVCVCWFCIIGCSTKRTDRVAALTQTSSLPAQGVHIPFTFRDGMIHVSAKANGKPASWLVDTGSDSVNWPARFQPRDDSAQRFKSKGYVDDMWMIASNGTLQSFDIGGYKIANLRGDRVESKMTSEFILGNTALKDICVVFDFKRRQLILRESNAADYPIKPGSHTASLLTTRYPVAKGGPLVVSGKLGGRPAKFVIDTGCNGFAVSKQFADKFLKRYHRRPAVVVGISGSRRTVAAENVSGEIAGRQFRRVPLCIIRDVPEADAIIGTSFLKNYLVTIDYPNMKLILENP